MGGGGGGGGEKRIKNRAMGFLSPLNELAVRKLLISSPSLHTWALHTDTYGLAWFMRQKHLTDIRGARHYQPYIQVEQRTSCDTVSVILQ